jgi:hypothetical protein
VNQPAVDASSRLFGVSKRRRDFQAGRVEAVNFGDQPNLALAVVDQN